METTNQKELEALVNQIEDLVAEEAERSPVMLICPDCASIYKVPGQYQDIYRVLKCECGAEIPVNPQTSPPA
jgi:uncharacterized protein with PIN domain